MPTANYLYDSRVITIVQGTFLRTIPPRSSSYVIVIITIIYIEIGVYRTKVYFVLSYMMH